MLITFKWWSDLETARKKWKITERKMENEFKFIKNTCILKKGLNTGGGVIKWKPAQGI